MKKSSLLKKYKARLRSTVEQNLTWDDVAATKQEIKYYNNSFFDYMKNTTEYEEGDQVEIELLEEFVKDLEKLR